MGKAWSSSLTRENSCSGPRTSSGLYVVVPLFYVAICSECVYSLRSILNMTVIFLTPDCRVFNGLHCLIAKTNRILWKKHSQTGFRCLSCTGSWVQILPPLFNKFIARENFCNGHLRFRKILTPFISVTYSKPASTSWHASCTVLATFKTYSSSWKPTSWVQRRVVVFL